MHSISSLQFTLGQHRYPVTAVGSVAEDNLRELGDVTLRFDGLNEAEFAGALSMWQALYPTISRRDRF